MAANAFGGRPNQAIACIDRGVRLSLRDIFGEEYEIYYATAHFQACRYVEAAQRAIEPSPRQAAGNVLPVTAVPRSTGHPNL